MEPNGESGIAASLGGIMKKWKKLHQIKPENLHIGCLNCSTACLKAPMNMRIAVGFGCAVATKDDCVVYDGERDIMDRGDCRTFMFIENMARKDPDHDWRIVKHGPLHGETFQRHGNNEWVCIESNKGFA